MSAVGLGSGRWIDGGAFPAATTTSVHELTTVDGAKVTGVLRTLPGATTVITLMHPRQDVTHHVLVPELLARGYAVWTQGSRSPNNDLSLIHEQALLDFAAGQERLRALDFASVVGLGHSGGATLTALYAQQSGRIPDERLRDAPSGRPVPLAEATMPRLDGAVFLAPHPGQGALLERVIDPSVADEADPLSVDPSLDPFSPDNGFVPAPEPTRYAPDFISRYRAAQRARMERLDAEARRRVAEAQASTAEFKATGDARHRRRALAPHLITVYRTDADLRNVDLSIDPNQRPYGSLFGRRPDLTNFGLVGFGRMSTPDAFLSTWSSLSTRADFVGCAPGVDCPTLLVGFTGDQASFPADLERMANAIGAADLERDDVAGTHFGGPISAEAKTGASLAAERIGRWLSSRFAAIAAP